MGKTFQEKGIGAPARRHLSSDARSNASAGRLRVAALVLSAAALIGASASASAADYTFTILDSLMGSTGSSYAFAINSTGQVAGYSDTVRGTRAATLWRGTTPTDLGSLSGTNSYGGSYAFAINNYGQVAGYSDDGLNTHAVLWNGTALTDLGTLGGPHSYAWGINDAGRVVGHAYTADGSLHATLWNGTDATDLGGLGGNESYARGINDAGQVVGVSSTGSTNHATLWSGTTPTDLGTLPGGTWSYADAINDAGQIVGVSSVGSTVHATLWSDDILIDLGAACACASYARAINNAGQIVGYSQSRGLGFDRATLWNGTTPTDLNSFLSESMIAAGWILTDATGINNNGWIVGRADNMGVQRAYLLTPTAVVPEPEAYALALASLGVLSFFAASRRKGAHRSD